MGIPNLILGGVGLGDQIGLQIDQLIQSTGCGSTCTTSSAIANTAETLGKIITSRYFSIPAPRTTLEQAAALADVDKVVNWAIASCSSPALGDAGQRCINERYIKGGSAPWCPTGTGCDYITVVRDPIASDATVDSPQNLYNAVPLPAAGGQTPGGFNTAPLGPPVQAPAAAGSIFSSSTIVPGLPNGAVLAIGFLILILALRK